MVTPSNTPYKVLLDNVEYNITPDGIIPVIIDYGYTSIRMMYKGKEISIGEHSKEMFDTSGFVPYCIPAYDMYKFLNSMVKRCGRSNKVQELFKFFKDDPYDILKDKNNSIRARHDFCKKVTSSDISQQTPLSFLQWILSNPEYAQILKKTLNLTTRYTWKTIPKSLQTTDALYSSIMKETTDIRNCIPKKIPQLYCLMYLIIYTQPIPTINAVMKTSKSTMIMNDLRMLNKYKTINMNFNTQEFNDIYTKLLNTTLNDKPEAKKEIMKLFQTMIQPYLHFLMYISYIYMIYQFKIQDDYTQFLQEFIKSSQYDNYIKYTGDIEYCIRWYKTLNDSIFWPEFVMKK
jgi:hypothetical protein